MPVTVNINSAQIAMNIRAAADKAVAIVSEQIVTDCNEFIPADQWVLRDSSLIHTSLEGAMKHTSLTAEQQKILSEATGSDFSNGNITWSTPYARFLYHGVPMVDAKTGSPWARKDQIKVKTNGRLKYSKFPNPKACSHWCEKAKAAYGNTWQEIYEAAFRKELNK